MKIKKMLLLVVAMVLVCAISVTGTLAYLTAQTSAVTNTFVSASGLVETLTLDESKAVLDDATGRYNLVTANRVQGNSYTVLPDTVLDKDPTIHITGRTNTPAFLYVEIVDNTGGDIEWEEADCWDELAGANGQNGGVVYKYTGTIADGNIGILKDDKVTVAKAPNLGSSGKTLEFYAYMAQASIDSGSDPATIYNACFPAP